MADSIDAHEAVFVIYCIQNSIIALSDSVTFARSELLCAGWTRVVFQVAHYICHLPDDFLG